MSGLVHCDGCQTRRMSEYCDSVWVKNVSILTKSHCDICFVEFNSQSTKRGSIMCRSCNWSLKSTASLVAHSLIVHHQGRRPFQCNHCSQHFQTHNLLETHIQQQHSYSVADLEKILMEININFSVDDLNRMALELEIECM